MSGIRAKAVCLFRRGSEVLLANGYEPKRDEVSLIPVGGGVEFGEYSIDAAARETFEEINVVAINLHLLGVVENMFEFDGRPMHEIVFIYQGDFEDESLYRQSEFKGVEDNGWEFPCKWYEIAWLREGHLPFYPTGIIDLL